jgi:putative endonuclease
VNERSFWVYLMASRKGGAIYVGVTSDLAHRTFQHKEGLGGIHTSRYRIRRLVYAEKHRTAIEAIEREKRLKKWKRAWKVALIEEGNPDWNDLTELMIN